MSLPKPFYRITRPKAFIPDYIMDSRYATDRLQLSRAYINIENNLLTIFNYIEPDEKNKDVFSFELYSLLLRACTEVELNCKLIMEANGAIATGQHFTMTDYIKLEKSSKLSKYKVSYGNWRNYDATNSILYEKKIIVPFANFNSSPPTAPQWYKDYNAVKHNREANLYKASLDNCISAIAGILVLLYSQFGSLCIDTCPERGVYINEEGAFDFLYEAKTIFDIVPPAIADWNPNELYDFDWETLKNHGEPFERFIFD